MFDSGVTAFELIEQIKSEADIAPDVPAESFAIWLNSTEQFLYSEIIKEQAETRLENVQTPVQLENIAHPEGTSPVRYEDIHAVFAGNTQLIASTLTSGVLFPNSYYKDNGQLGLHLTKPPQEIRIVYFVRPMLKEPGKVYEHNVMVPPEFLDLIRAKLRAEAYKVANEDGLAAKWMNDYNVLLETFKAWISGKQPEFGM